MTTLAAAGATCTAAAERLVEASSDWSVDLEAAAMTLSYGTGSIWNRAPFALGAFGSAQRPRGGVGHRAPARLVDQLVNPTQKGTSEVLCSISLAVFGGRYWTRTSDLHDVNVAL
jgi:hypothetical protein